MICILILTFISTGLISAHSLTLGFKIGAGAGAGGLELEWALLPQIALYGGGSLGHGIVTGFLGARFYHREEGNRLFFSPFLGGAVDTTTNAKGFSYGISGGWEWKFHAKLRLLLEGGMLFGFDKSRLPSFGASIGYRFF